MTAPTPERLDALADEALGYAYNDTLAARAAMLTEAASALRSASEEVNRLWAVELRAETERGVWKYTSSQFAKICRDRDRFHIAILNAPHADGCMGGYQHNNEPVPCTCWKAGVL